MSLKLQTLRHHVAAVCAAAAVPFLLACGVKAHRQARPCDYVIAEAQDLPGPVFLGVCQDRVDSLPNLRPLAADSSSAEALLQSMDKRGLQESIGPLAVFVSAGGSSTERTESGPSFCMVQGAGTQLLILRASGCTSASEDRLILLVASRLTRRLSWSLLDSTGKIRFRNALLKELKSLSIEIDDVRLLSYSIGEPAP